MLINQRPGTCLGAPKGDTMPNRDGTGPMGQGQGTGGGWGACTSGTTEGPGMGGSRGRGGRGGGRGHRNQFHATGLTGWQRAELADLAPAPIDAPFDRLEQIEGRLEQALTRLEALEAKDSR